MVSLRSQVNRKLLGYFFHNPGKSLYVNKIASQLNLDKRNLVKKLRIFEHEGLFISATHGHYKFYSLNKDYPFYREYKRIILKSIGSVM